MNPILALGQIIVSIALIAAILLQARGTGLSGTNIFTWGGNFVDGNTPGGNAHGSNANAGGANASGANASGKATGTYRQG